MILNWQLAVAVVGGAVVGLGVFLLLREALPAAPALGPALRRLHPVPGVATRRPGLRHLDLLGGLARWLRPPRRELALLDRTPEQYALSLLLSGLVGLLTPAVAGVLFALGGTRLPVVLPVLASLGFAGVAVLLAHRDMLAKAEHARREFVRAVCTYLDLVALQMAAAHGPVQALEQAAATCDGWVFARIREALRAAQLQLRPPWDELRDVADRIGVPELGDVGAIMQSSGTDGAPVHESLRSRADSLRDQIRTDALAKAEGITSRLDIPGALLVFVLTGFVLYPFVARI